MPEALSTLNNISLVVPYSGLLAITGPVGSGKTTLLQTILGELLVTTGSVSTATRYTGFCAQTTWLQGGSLRDQILFGERYHEERYSEVIRACALEHDVASLPLGDATEVGNNGDKLSGGQRQRIAIARAVYSKARFMIFDDILSALDKTTANHVLMNVFSSNGILRKAHATAILVTQSAFALRHAEHIVVLDSDGHLAHQGTWEAIVAVSSHVQSLMEVERQDHDSVTSGAVDDMTIHSELRSERNVPQSTAVAGLDVETVTRHRHRGDLGLYKTYVDAAGHGRTMTVLLLFAISAFSLNFPTLLLKWWSNTNAISPNKNIAMYLSSYILLSLVALSSLTLACWIILTVIVPRSGEKFHVSVAKTALSATFGFLCTTDVGELTNRFTQDMQLIDTQLPIAALNTFEAAANVLVQIVLVCATASYSAIAIPICIICVYYVQRFYLLTSRQVRLIEIEAKAPLYSHLLSIPQGLVTIRAFRAQHRMSELCMQLLDQSQKPFYLLFCIQRWLNFVLDCLIGALAIIVVVIAVEVPGSIPAGSAGVALVTVLNCNQTLANLITFWTMMETSLGAVGRVRDFEQNTPREDDPNRETPMPSAQWPHHGRLEIKNVTCSWREDAEPVLRGISLAVEPGQHVGICGRTGSGKSSLLLALFQMLTLRAGTIYIDEIDISTLKPDELRSSLKALPQQPFIIPNNDLRSNLCLGKFIDDDILRQALESVGLWSSIPAAGLDTLASSIGFSHGQLQLFCFARVLLSNSKVVVLDEATSSCDAQTNDRIQRLVHTELRDRTVIAVEHRLENLLAYDQVVVLDNGQLMEYGSPGTLLNTPGSKFKQMCEASSAHRM